MAEIVVTDEAVAKAACVFYGDAYGSVGDEGNKVLHDGAREALEASAPFLQVQGAHLPNRLGARSAEIDLDTLEKDVPAPPVQVDREALERVLATHRIECTGPGEVTCRDCRDMGWMSWSAFHGHVADAVLALLSPEETK